MKKLLPLTPVYTTVCTKLNFRSRRARLLAFVIFVGLLPTIALSASSATSVRHLLFANRGEGAPNAPTLSASFARQNLFVPLAQTPIDCALNIARRGHSATLLTNGKILIAGGENQHGFVTEAEIFDPGTGTFSVSGNLNLARADHSATPLPDGRVLIAGGRGAMGILNSTEIFDPVSGAFTNGPRMNNARAGHTATILSDGGIVLAGGDDSGTIEIYDNSAHAFASLSVTLATPRAFHGATLLNDGRILIVGGTALDGSGVKSGELLDVANRNITASGNNAEDEHLRPLLRVLPDGKVQIIGGSDHEVMEIYDPAVNQFGAHAHVFPLGDSHPELLQQIMDAPTRAAMFRPDASSILLNRSGHTMSELPVTNEALIAGGADSNAVFLKSASTLHSSPARITTDKLDYAPGTPVVVSGAGFQPNEVVTFTFHEDPHIDTEIPHTFTVQADANGNFSCQDYAPEDEDRGVTYILAAKGGSSGWTAQTALTDSVPPTISLTALATSACENFNTLASTGSSSATTNGWTFLESGASANITYTAGTGSSTTGDTYSFGAASNPERAFGELTTGGLNSTIGANFTNNTGQTITTLSISYTGEQWRLGALNRTDRLDFQYSTDATSLTTGTWADVNALDFTAPVQGPATGALDGNASANRTSINATISGLNIANEATFWIRWTSIDAGSSDDGLAIDDFCLTPQGVPDVSLAVSPTTVDEDGATNLVYTFTRSHTSGGALTANFSVGGDATFNTDYTQTGANSFSSSAGTVTFAAGQATATVTIDPSADLTVESDETVILTITSGAGYNIASPSSASGTITEDDAMPTISIDDVTHNEGNSGTTSYTFTVTKTGTTDLVASIDFATANGSASAGSDYMATSGTLTFEPGEDSKTITVLVNGETTFENNETFFANLSDANNATISDGQGVGTITNDDDEPSFSIGDVTLNEGNSGTTSFTFTVSKAGATELPSSVNYQTMDGTTLQPGDYQSTSGTLTFATNEPTKQITVLVVGDTTYETNETFTVKLSTASEASIGDDEGLGTITNDDAAPNFEIDDVGMNEGTESGTTAFVFTITKSGATELTATVDFTTANGTTNPASGAAACGAGVDYASSNGTLTFAANETTKTFTVEVCRDGDNEADETFFVNLSNATQATISDGQGVGTITNDDGVVSYMFQGFFAPIDNPPLINTTKAGSAVPVKWRLTTSNGAAVSDPASFVGLFSYAVECASSAQLETPLETTAPGESRLTYLGDGNWQLNWKTLSSYPKGSCRVLDLLLQDGTHHYANFKFK